MQKEKCLGLKSKKKKNLLKMNVTFMGRKLVQWSIQEMNVFSHFWKYSPVTIAGQWQLY